MELTYVDKGKYLRGLLILIGKDNIIDIKENNKLLEIGKKLGFDKEFCKNAINEYFENKFINLNPPKFSSKLAAEQFIVDAINLAIIDNDFHTDELEWLEKIAKTNNLDLNWFDDQIKKVVLDYNPKNFVNLTQNYIVKNSIEET